MAFLIDLHTHTSRSSGCGRMTASELIEAAIEAGLDGIAVTEHWLIEGAEVAQALGRSVYGFPVFRGIEAHATIVGDVLVFGYYRDLPPFIPWDTLRRVVAEAGGVLIPAHPFRRRDPRSLWSHLQAHGLSFEGGLAAEMWMEGLAGVEVLNGSNAPEENLEAARLAALLGLPGCGGSDAHTQDWVGRAATAFAHPIESDADLVAALKRGGYWTAKPANERRW